MTDTPTQCPAEAAQLIATAEAAHWTVTTGTTPLPDGGTRYYLHATNNPDNCYTERAWVAADWRTADGQWTPDDHRPPYLMYDGYGLTATVQRLAELITSLPVRN
ncbi:hypothetical protein ACIOJE_35115 [Kitasatospora sp. NPDC087861]|uniref:hypothetical protein n=1 Tax=Kitasatospora sp. NPDC087861 TaxID=3364070 RepID=UPI0038100B07